MSKIIFSFCFFTSTILFGQLKKVDNLQEAKRIAQSENKDIIMEFTGSNWCKPCIRMEKEVLSNLEFQKFAKDKFVLFVLDLQMPISIDSENYKTFEKYEKQYKVNFYPTYIILDKDGKEKKRLKGYFKLNNFIKKLSK